jgi:hypothetical protein
VDGAHLPADSMRSGHLAGTLDGVDFAEVERGNHGFQWNFDLIKGFELIL